MRFIFLMLIQLSFINSAQAGVKSCALDKLARLITPLKRTAQEFKQEGAIRLLSKKEQKDQAKKAYLGLAQTIDKSQTSLMKRLFLLPYPGRLRNPSPQETWKLRPLKLVNDVQRKVLEKVFYQKGRTPTAPVMIIGGVVFSLPFWPLYDRIHHKVDQEIEERGNRATERNFQKTVEEDYLFSHFQGDPDRADKAMILALTYQEYYRFMDQLGSDKLSLTSSQVQKTLLEDPRFSLLFVGVDFFLNYDYDKDPELFLERERFNSLSKEEKVSFLISTYQHKYFLYQQVPYWFAEDPQLKILPQEPDSKGIYSRMNQRKDFQRMIKKRDQGEISQQDLINFIRQDIDQQIEDLQFRQLGIKRPPR